MPASNASRLSNWLSATLFLLGFVLPLGALMVALFVGYRVIFAAFGLAGCAAVAVVQLATWFLIRPEIPPSEKLERKLAIFWMGKKLFWLSMLFILVGPPLYAWFVLGDPVPASIVYGSVVGAVVVGGVLVAVAKVVSDRFSNFPFH